VPWPAVPWSCIVPAPGAPLLGGADAGAATVTVAAMRACTGVGIVAGVGFTMSAAVGYLRIAADQHHLTDILIGSAVGASSAGRSPASFTRPFQEDRRRQGRDRREELDREELRPDLRLGTVTDPRASSPVREPGASAGP